MPEDKFECKLSWRFRIEKMSGKEGTYIIRNRKGLILAFIEKQNDNITNFIPHQNRWVSKSIINRVAEYIIKKGYAISKDTAKSLGISIIKPWMGETHYITSLQLRKYGLTKALSKKEISHITIYNIYKQSLTIPSETQNILLDLTQANIYQLRIENNVQAEIDIRENQQINRLILGPNFNGKLYSGRSGLKKMIIADNVHAEITHTQGFNNLKLKIGEGFNGILDIKNTYMKYLRIGKKCAAHLKIEKSIFFGDISIEKDCSSEIICSSVYARYFDIGKNFTGHLHGESQSSKQGVRNLYIGDDFSGTVDLSGSNTIERVELGKCGQGKIEFIGCKSIRLVRMKKLFAGEMDFTESNIVFIHADSPCSGRVILQETNNLARLEFPEKHTCTIILGKNKVIKTEKKGNETIYYFRRIKLTKGYFLSLTPKTWQKVLRNLLS